MQLRPEGPVVKVVEGLVGGVFRITEDRARVPVVAFPGQEVAAFEQQHPLAGFGHPRRGGRAPRPAADDQDVVVIIPCRRGHGGRSPTLDCDSPPSTVTVVALTYPALFEARNTTRSAISAA